MVWVIKGQAHKCVQIVSCSEERNQVFAFHNFEKDKERMDGFRMGEYHYHTCTRTSMSFPSASVQIIIDYKCC
jgi:hypothetical protein